jgi:hypothetical protein
MRRASCSVVKSGSKTKLLVTQQIVLVYFLEGPSEKDLLELAISVNLTCGCSEDGCLGSFPRLHFWYHASVFICWWELLPAEDCVKHICQKGYRAVCRCLRTLFGIPFGPEALPTWVLYGL